MDHKLDDPLWQPLAGAAESSSSSGDLTIWETQRSVWPFVFQVYSSTQHHKILQVRIKHKIAKPELNLLLQPLTPF